MQTKRRGKGGGREWDDMRKEVKSAWVELVSSKDLVVRYQVGTKKMKTSRYQIFSSTGGTKYPVNPVLDAYSLMISTMQKRRQNLGIQLQN